MSERLVSDLISFAIGIWWGCIGMIILSLVREHRKKMAAIRAKIERIDDRTVAIVRKHRQIKDQIAAKQAELDTRPHVYQVPTEHVVKMIRWARRKDN